jgi:hypothetical protein
MNYAAKAHGANFLPGQSRRLLYHLAELNGQNNAFQRRPGGPLECSRWRQPPELCASGSAPAGAAQLRVLQRHYPAGAP